MTKQLFKDSAVYGVGIVASRFINLLLLPIYTRVFGQSEYGLLDLLISTSIVLVVLSELQIVSAVSREYYEVRDKFALRRLIGSAVAMYVVSSSFFLIAGCALYSLAGTRLTSYVGWRHVVPLLLTLFPTQVFGLFQNLLRLKLRRWQFVVFSVADISTSTAFSVSFVFSGFGTAGVLWGLLFSKAIWGTVLLVLNRDLVSWRIDRTVAKSLLSYGAPLVPSVLTKWSQSYANRYVLALTLTLSQVARYSVAIQLSAIVALVDLAFQQAWTPRAMKLFGEPRSEPIFARTFRLYLGGMFLIATGVALFGGMAVRIAAGQKYAGSVPLVPFLAFGLFWNGVAGMVSMGNAWARQTYWNVAGLFAGVAVNVILLLLTVKLLGLMAAALTYLTGTLLSALVILATAQRSHRIPYDWLELVGAIIGSIGMTFALYSLNTSGFLRASSLPFDFGVRVALFVPIVALVYTLWALSHRNGMKAASADIEPVLSGGPAAPHVL